ncbi:MAG: hypothetical protein ACI906_004142 [Candidatus Latescibacterota bacterium]|jgi:hypothetical protein
MRSHHMKEEEILLLSDRARNKLLQRVKSRVETGYYERKSVRQVIVVALLEHVRWFERKVDKENKP